MDIQLEKQKFFALYWRQEVFRYNTTIVMVDHNLMIKLKNDYWAENGYLELNDLKDITDEDAIALAFDELGGNKDKADLIKHAKEKIKYQSMFPFKQRDVDLLRSKSYAVDFKEYKVKRLIEMGWVKLIQKP